MSATPVGLAFAALCLRYAGSPTRLVQLVFFGGVFDAAAALILGGFGMQPALLPAMGLVALVGLQYATGRRSVVEQPALHAMAPLLLLLAYAAISAKILPETFAGRIIVWPQKFNGIDPQPLPLAPGQGNMNQVAYLALNVLLALATTLLLGRRGVRWTALVKAYLLSGYAVMGIMVWELASRTVGLPFPSDLFYSNPGWSIVQQQLGSFPRLQGPFPEPSALAFYLSGLAFACAGLCLNGQRVMRADLLLVMACLAIFLSTSTTGIATILVGLPIQFLVASTRRRDALRRLLRMLAVPVTVAAVLGGIIAMQRPELLDLVSSVVEMTVNKADSESYIERGTMNTLAWNAFYASGGLGIGWGSTRTSSVIPGLLAGVGIVGGVTVLWFMFRLRGLLRRAKAVAPPGHPALILLHAFGAALAGQMLAGIFSAPMITTPIFYVQVGAMAAAAARILLDTATARQRAQAAPPPPTPARIQPARSLEPIPRG